MDNVSVGSLVDGYNHQCCGGQVVNYDTVCCGDAASGDVYAYDASKMCCGEHYVHKDDHICCEDAKSGAVKVPNVFSFADVITWY